MVGKGPVRFVCTSDTHGQHRALNVPEGDVFVHAGDFMRGGLDWREIVDFNEWLGTLPHSFKVVIAGNHELLFERRPDRCRALLTNAIYLEHEAKTVLGCSLFGSPFTPPFMHWAFMKTEDELAAMYREMPQELDVLITHGPPRGYLDPGFQADHVGSEALLEAVLQRRIRHHVFGHLHGAGGLTKRMVIVDIHPHHVVEFHNVAAVDEAYRLKNEALEFEI